MQEPPRKKGNHGAAGVEEEEKQNCDFQWQSDSKGQLDGLYAIIAEIQLNEDPRLEFASDRNRKRHYTPT